MLASQQGNEELAKDWFWVSCDMGTQGERRSLEHGFSSHPVASQAACLVRVAKEWPPEDWTPMRDVQAYRPHCPASSWVLRDGPNIDRKTALPLMGGMAVPGTRPPANSSDVPYSEGFLGLAKSRLLGPRPSTSTFSNTPRLVCAKRAHRSGGVFYRPIDASTSNVQMGNNLRTLRKCHSRTENYSLNRWEQPTAAKGCTVAAIAECDPPSEALLNARWC